MDNQLELLEFDVQTALNQAKNFRVFDDVTYTKAGESLKQIQTWIKMAGQKYDAGIKEAYKAHQAKVAEKKALTNMLAQLKTIFKDAMDAYSAEKEQERRKAVEAEQARLAAATPEAPASLAPVAPIPDLPKISGIYEVEEWSAEVVDASLVPDEFKMLDMAKIQERVVRLKNLANIPGVLAVMRKATRGRSA